LYLLEKNTLITLGGYDALPIAVRGTIPTIFDLRITMTLNHVAIQLFVAGLKPTIHHEMMKGMLVLLYDAFQQANTLEKN
jgi:hypothetical protein